MRIKALPEPSPPTQPEPVQHSVLNQTGSCMAPLGMGAMRLGSTSRHAPSLCLPWLWSQTSLLTRSPPLGHPPPSQGTLGSSSATQAGQALAMPPPPLGAEQRCLGHGAPSSWSLSSSSLLSPGSAPCSSLVSLLGGRGPACCWPRAPGCLVPNVRRQLRCLLLTPGLEKSSSARRF